MNKHAIGNTGVQVTPLCFGTSALGSMPDTYGYAVDAKRAQATLEAIFDSEVNFLDTSRLYGVGESEKRIGEAIRARGGLPQGFVISTKLDRDGESGRFDAAQARRSLEESLQAMGLDRVQVLHLHDPEYAADLDEVTRSGGALDELFKMKEEGLADAVGLAMGKLPLMERLLFKWPFDCLISHNRFTLLNREADDLFTRAHAAGMAIFNAAPFAGGVLAKGSAGTQKITYQDADDAALAPVRAIEAQCNEHGIAPGAAALQFSMRDPRITATLVGVSKPERVAETLAWQGAEISEAAWQALMALPYSSEDPEANRVYKLR